MVIAGPGAGKMHDMVHRIAEALPDLRPNRILAAITFTNKATESIKKRLQDIIQIPANVFVGTNYSFFNQFILLPFATLFGHTPLDKVFFEIDFRKIVERNPGNKPSFAARNAIRKKVVKRLLNDGKIPFEQIAQVSAAMQEKRVRAVVSNRIQFLFKDEFQDTDTVQLRIFDEIRKGKKTKMYSVGDPEQYILGFTYDLRGVKKPSFDKIPINKFASECRECQEIDINRRACEQLVKFTNHFHTRIKQRPVDGNEDGGVFFIAENDLDIVISKFIDLTQDVFNSCKDTKRLLLGYENETFAGFKEKYGLVPISNEHNQSRGILSDTLDLLSSAVQLNGRVIAEKSRSR